MSPTTSVASFAVLRQDRPTAAGTNYNNNNAPVPTILHVAAIIIHCCMVLCWMQYYFLRLLTNEALDMNERQMDPTDIVKVPYDRSRLLIFVSFPTLLYCVILPLVRLFCNNNKNNHPCNTRIKMTLISIINRIIEVIILTMVYFCTFIVAGASPFEKIIHTILAALYCATLSSSSSSSLLWIGGNDDDDSMQQKKITPVMTLIDQILFRLFFLSPEDVILYEDNNTDDRKLSTKKRSLQQRQEEIMAGWILRSIIVILVPMQILLLYDRGWQIQRWPVPVILGTTIGWVIGTLIGTVSILIGSTS